MQTNAASTSVPTRSSSRHLGVVMASQAISSGGNFVAALMAARSGTGTEYGSVAIVLAFYATTAALVRPLAGNVIQTTVLKAGPGPQRDQAAGTLSLAFLLALVPTVVFVPVGAWIFPAGSSLLLVAVSLVPLLAVHDTMRLWAVSIERPAFALWLDLGWLLLQGLGLAVAHARYGLSSPSVAVCWAGAGAGAALGGWVAATAGSRGVGSIRRAAQASRRLGGAYLAEAGLSALTGTGYLLLLPVVATIRAIGHIQVLELPFGLVTAGTLGLTLFVQPACRRYVLAGETPRAWRTALSAGLAVLLGATLTAMACLLLPVEGMQGVFGDAYARDVGSILAVSLKYASFGPLLVVVVMSRSLGLHGRVLPARATHTGAGVVLAMVVATWSVAGSYVVLYGVVIVGGIELARRMRRRSALA